MPSSAIKAIFTKTFVAISLINMLGLAGYYAIFVVSTQFLSEVFHASTAVAGLATGIIVIGCLVGRFFTGSIVHSAGYRRVLFCGVVLYLLTNAAYFFADTLALIFLVRFVSGVAVGIRGNELIEVPFADVQKGERAADKGLLDLVDIMSVMTR